MPDLARTLLAPLLLAQARRLFKTMPRLPEATGDRQGTAGDGPSLRLLVVGDSSAAGVGVDTQDQALLGRTVARLAEGHRVTYRLEARNGATLGRTLRHLKRLDPAPFDVAVTSVGANDVTAGTDLDSWLGGYRDLVAELRSRFQVGRVVVSGLPPMGRFPALPNPLRWVIGRQVRRHDAALQTWIQSDPTLSYAGLGTVPGDRLNGVPMTEIMAADGFHPGPRIYDVWSERVVDRIQRGVGTLNSNSASVR